MGLAEKALCATAELRPSAAVHSLPDTATAPAAHREQALAKDLPGWGAVLLRDLTVRFKEPEVLFDTGKDVLKPRFIDIQDIGELETHSRPLR